MGVHVCYYCGTKFDHIAGVVEHCQGKNQHNVLKYSSHLMSILVPWNTRLRYMKELYHMIYRKLVRAFVYRMIPFSFLTTSIRRGTTPRYWHTIDLDCWTYLSDFIAYKTSNEITFYLFPSTLKNIYESVNWIKT
jgi:hypothetical protein